MLPWQWEVTPHCQTSDPGNLSRQCTPDVSPLGPNDAALFQTDSICSLGFIISIPYLWRLRLTRHPIYEAQWRTIKYWAFQVLHHFASLLISVIFLKPRCCFGSVVKVGEFIRLKKPLQGLVLEYNSVNTPHTKGDSYRLLAARGHETNTCFSCAVSFKSAKCTTLSTGGTPLLKFMHL